VRWDLLVLCDATVGVGDGERGMFSMVVVVLMMVSPGWTDSAFSGSGGGAGASDGGAGAGGGGAGASDFFSTTSVSFSVSAVYLYMVFSAMRR
jgi:hypothetical protein